jgi:hypothetical protein
MLDLPAGCFTFTAYLIRRTKANAILELSEVRMVECSNWPYSQLEGNARWVVKTAGRQ